MPIVRGNLGDPLTDRERQVFALVQKGYSNANIAKMLKITEDTVKYFMSNLLAKMGARSRLELVIGKNSSVLIELRRRDLRIIITRLESRLAAAQAELAILNEEQPHEDEAKVFDLSTRAGHVAGVRANQPDLVHCRNS